MSNFNWFQSKYGYRRRAMAPYPQPMGGSFGQPYEMDPERPYDKVRRPYTVNGPYNYGVFSPKTPYSFPDYYEDPHLESMGGFSGFGGTTVGGVEITCSPGVFIDKFVKKIAEKLGGFSVLAKPVLNLMQSRLNALAASAFASMIEKVNQGEGAFRTWFMINVAYNLEQATGLPQAVLGMIPGIIFQPVVQTLNECKASVSPFVAAGGAVTGSSAPQPMLAIAHLEHLATPPKPAPAIAHLEHLAPAPTTTTKSSVLPLAAAAVAAMLLLK